MRRQHQWTAITTVRGTKGTIIINSSSFNFPPEPPALRNRLRLVESWSRERTLCSKFIWGHGKHFGIVCPAYSFIWLCRVLVAACRIFIVVWDCFFFSLACKIFSCSLWDIVPRTGMEPGPPGLGAWSLSHWTTREVPCPGFCTWWGTGLWPPSQGRSGGSITLRG